MISTITRHERENISFHFISKNICLTSSCRFLHPNYLFQLSLPLFQCIGSVKTSSGKLAMVFCFQICSNLLWENYILVIENFILEILGLQPQISESFSRNCSDLSISQKIVLMILNFSENSQPLALNLQKFFSMARTIFSHSNNFWGKIPIFFYFMGKISNLCILSAKHCCAWLDYFPSYNILYTLGVLGLSCTPTGVPRVSKKSKKIYK